MALCIRWPKYWSFSFSISPSNEYSKLISFRIDYCDLLAVQRTLKSLLQHHHSKASTLIFSFMSRFQFSSVQFSLVSQSCPTLCDPMNPCPSPTPGVHPDSRPSSQCCHPAISSSVIPFSSCPQSLPASESFPMRQLFT